MITTVTLNPMLDKTVRLEGLKRGSIHRATSVTMTAGGKGVNVSRQLRFLGIETVATGFLGGNTGEIIRTLMDNEGIRHDFIDTGLVTREGVTYLEADGTSTAVFEPSEKVPVECVHQLSRKIATLAAESTWMVCSGSSPGGEADDVFYEAILSAHKAERQSVLDSYGTVFSRALKAVPTLVKQNKSEFEQSLGTKLADERAIRRALRDMISAGVHYCVLTDGSRPAYAASGDGEWKISPPDVRMINPIGSGDSMLAGMMYGFSEQWDFERALRFGSAAGAANAQVWEVANSSREEILKLEPRTTVQRFA